MSQASLRLNPYPKGIQEESIPFPKEEFRILVGTVHVCVHVICAMVCTHPCHLLSACAPPFAAATFTV